ncbi:hypothetical protein BT96DRAFT_647063 [Gymnopus androsaceus JB14]|uniref:Uncharacterized protein n=1 Tax=Gymnopus androsaceus JB14 TaxID=1447944 RepID=A0A6A4HRV3_9AGAR|nr:hypothetical protein BT96DRAFT_647063 [Gymnopus androsaceus JB14]
MTMPNHFPTLLFPTLIPNLVTLIIMMLNLMITIPNTLALIIGDYLHQLPSDHSSNQSDVSDTQSDASGALDNYSNADSEAASADFPEFEFELDEDHPGPLNWDFFYANQHLFYTHQSSNGSSDNVSDAPSFSASNIFGPDGKLLESERERRRRLQLCFYCGGDHFRANCEQLRAKERHADVSAAVSDGSTGSHGSVGSDNGSEYSAY